jgi:hypothetical protein
MLGTLLEQLKMPSIIASTMNARLNEINSEIVDSGVK